MEFMGEDVLLLMFAGSLVAIAATTIVLIEQHLTGSRFKSHSAARNRESESPVVSKPFRESQSESSADFNHDGTSVTIYSSPIQEAPSPFPEDSSSPMKNTVPTDVSSVAGVSSVSASASPLLVVATPKRRGRTRSRLPSEATRAPRRRRLPKRPVVTETTVPPISVAPISTAPTESAATSSPEPAHHETGQN
jgi:hypothetical protein